MPAIVLDEWISLGQIGCRSITARAKRQPEAAQTDMPLNSAVYEPGRDMIYGVRGGYVFRFNSSGVVQECSRFVVPEMDDTYIAYDATTDMLWATMRRAFGSPTDASFPAKYLVKIDPDTLAATAYSFRNQVTFGDNWVNTHSGPFKILCSGGFAFLLAYSDGVQEQVEGLHRINLSPNPPSLTHNFNSVEGGGYGDILIDGTVIWFCSNDGFNEIDARTLASLSVHADFVQLNGTTDRPYGIARNPGGAMYVVQATQFVLKGMPDASPALRSVIDIGRANATPFNIKYNSVDGLIYIPCWKDDTVVVLNPVDDSFVVKTGFDSPFDVVFTASKKFAVQHGPVGLLEIV